MKNLILGITILGFAIAIQGCARLPENPAFSFGKKCTVGEDGQVVYSTVWVYDKETGLEASKEACKILE
jgi:hypothetical protein